MKGASIQKKEGTTGGDFGGLDVKDSGASLGRDGVSSRLILKVKQKGEGKGRVFE